jgi:malate dehydrogenase
VRSKISIIGAGFAGTTAAHWCAAKELGDVVLLDVVFGLPQGRAMDLAEAAPVEGYGLNVLGTNDYDDTAGSEIVIVTAGVAHRPGMTRDDLVATNANVVRGVIQEVVSRSPEAVVILTTEPISTMTYLAKKVSDLPRGHVIGMRGVLQSARMRAFIALELGVSVASTQALVLGGDGDAVLPLPRYATVGGIPISELMPKERVALIVERTCLGDGAIASMLRTGNAGFASTAATMQVVEAILHDRKSVLPCSVYLDGEYGLTDICVGVPVLVGAGGVEKVLELDLTDDEAAALARSAASIRSSQQVLGQL